MSAWVCFIWGVSGFVISLAVSAVIAELTTRPPKDDRSEHERWCDCLCERCEPYEVPLNDGSQRDS